MDESLRTKVREKQATLNIGMIGHVAHGKSTLVSAISSVKTVRFKSELEKNITIKLGYANTKIYKCDSEKCARPGCYQAFKSSVGNNMKCGKNGCNGTLRLVRHVSFVDCPGHDVLMATMINGTAIMDAAILLIAASELCPQPQTREHLTALKKADLSYILVVQNKIDLVSRERCLQQYDTIRSFLKTTRASNSPIIPVSAQFKLNIDAVLDYIVNYIPDAERDIDCPPRMIIIRSFDINKPGYKVDMLKGGVIGGSLVCGKVKINDIIEIRPGLITMTKNGMFECKPYITKVVSLKTENTDLDVAYPGGLIGLGTTLDPSCCIADSLVGQVMGYKGLLPDVYVSISVKYELFDTVVMLKSNERDGLSINVKEVLLLGVGSISLSALLVELKDGLATFNMSKPVCCKLNEKIAISKKIRGSWRLIGCGVICGGTTIEPIYDEDPLDIDDLRRSLCA